MLTVLSGPVLWLQNCLNRTADDREEDGEYMKRVLNLLLLQVMTKKQYLLQSLGLNISGSQALLRDFLRHESWLRHAILKQFGKSIFYVYELTHYSAQNSHSYYNTNTSKVLP